MQDGVTHLQLLALLKRKGFAGLSEVPESIVSEGEPSTVRAFSLLASVSHVPRALFKNYPALLSTDSLLWKHNVTLVSPAYDEDSVMVSRE